MTLDGSTQIRKYSDVRKASERLVRKKTYITRKGKEVNANILNIMARALQNKTPPGHYETKVWTHDGDLDGYVEDAEEETRVVHLEGIEVLDGDEIKSFSSYRDENLDATVEDWKESLRDDELDLARFANLRKIGRSKANAFLYEFPDDEWKKHDFNLDGTKFCIVSAFMKHFTPHYMQYTRECVDVLNIDPADYNDWDVRRPVMMWVKELFGDFKVRIRDQKWCYYSTTVSNHLTPAEYRALNIEEVTIVLAKNHYFHCKDAAATKYAMKLIKADLTHSEETPWMQEDNDAVEMDTDTLLKDIIPPDFKFSEVRARPKDETITTRIMTNTPMSYCFADLETYECAAKRHDTYSVSYGMLDDINTVDEDIHERVNMIEWEYISKENREDDSPLKTFIDDVIQYTFDMGHSTTVWLHNASGYDNVFIREYLLTHTNFEISGSEAGSSVIDLKFHLTQKIYVHILDFIKLVGPGMPLKNLGKSFGFSHAGFAKIIREEIKDGVTPQFKKRMNEVFHTELDFDWSYWVDGTVTDPWGLGDDDEAHLPIHFEKLNFDFSSTSFEDYKANDEQLEYYCIMDSKCLAHGVMAYKLIWQKMMIPISEEFGKRGVHFPMRDYTSSRNGEGVKTDFALHNFLTISSVSKAFFKLTLPKDAYELCGLMHDYVRTYLIGGHTQTGGNVSWRFEADDEGRLFMKDKEEVEITTHKWEPLIVPLDQNSMYPNAMAQSFPYGRLVVHHGAEVIATNLKKPEETIKHSPAKMHKITAAINGKPLPSKDIDLMCFKDNGVINWSTERSNTSKFPCNDETILQLFDLYAEDPRWDPEIHKHAEQIDEFWRTGLISKLACKHHVIGCPSCCGSKMSVTIHETISWERLGSEHCWWFEWLYNERLRVKKSPGNLQLVLKLLMNSTYGKLIEQVHGEKVRYFRRLKDVLTRNLISVDQVASNVYRAIYARLKPIRRMVGLGVWTLMNSKNSMAYDFIALMKNEVRLLYSDTDCIRAVLPKDTKPFPGYERWRERWRHVRDVSFGAYIDERLRKVGVNIGKKLGEQKIEYEAMANHAYILSKKMYSCHAPISEDDVVMDFDWSKYTPQPWDFHMKGITKKYIEPDHYPRLYNGEKLIYEMGVTVRRSTQTLGLYWLPMRRQVSL